MKVGTHWKWNPGNGFTVGQLDQENRNIGKFKKRIMNILVCRQRVYQGTYNNNNVLRGTGAFIMYKRIGGFTQYILTHHSVLGAATGAPPALTPRKTVAARLDDLAGAAQQESPAMVQDVA